ncbi:2-C-methyl-D-erythritol 4-phosphate cytidylyltransferase [Cytophaga hutchinsonii]|jgi:2-C-methyl-D-erythritol 4-phosphate cytidylyltransferase|nr:2-C-methyl-D-erythritol 4-phosphate cytidylyltransferase [Cytophaga hutchinsonii]
MNRFAVIVAGGSGSRMGSDTPKQFLPIGNAPILMHTIKRFFTSTEAVNIILVLPEEQMDRWHQLCEKYSFSIPHLIVSGGKNRFQSVRNGLNSIGVNDGLVAIHDGVRPFISKRIIEESFKVALEKGNAVAAVELKDSIRLVDKKGNKTVNRVDYRIVQTPQTFKISQVRDAFHRASNDQYTDDASVAEAAGYSIQLIEGSYENIKITTPEDLAMAEAILKKFDY